MATEVMYKSPAEIVDYCESTALHKTGNRFYQTAVLALFAGIYIALGALGSVVGGADLAAQNNPFGKLVAAAIFPIGLMFVIIAGGELFTGNCLIFAGLYRKKITIGAFFRNLVIVWIFNLLGSLLIVALTYYTNTLSENGIAYLHAVAAHKIHGSFAQILVRGIGCNILVAGAVWLAYAAKDVIGKIFGIWFPIMVFILLGFDHVVANMFYLPMALLTKADFSTLELIKNWAAATIGNFIGGSLVLAGLYCWVYPSKQK